MSSTVIAIASALCLTLAALPVQARSVVHPGGQFQLLLPETFKVTHTAKGLLALSKSGNVKVFARSEAHVQKSYDFTGHFARWEALVKSRGIYKTLSRVSDRKQVSGDGRTAVFRVYDAISLKTGKAQSYRVITLASHNPRRGRVYTLAIASHVDTYLKYGGQLRSIASSFLPLGATPVVKRISMRGKLLRRGGKIVALAAKPTAPQAIARAVAGRTSAPAPKATLAGKLGAVVRPRPAARPVGHKVLTTSHPGGTKKAVPPAGTSKPPSKATPKELRQAPPKPTVMLQPDRVSALQKAVDRR